MSSTAAIEDKAALSNAALHRFPRLEVYSESSSGAVATAAARLGAFANGHRAL